MTAQSNRQGERLTRKRNKIVVDTGVLVSAFAFHGIPERAVKKVFAEADIYISPALLKEYRDVPLLLETGGKIRHPQLKALISGIAAFTLRAKIVYPQKRLTVCRDAKDNMLLECCLEAKADILMTGDKDLLELENLPFDLKILRPRNFIEENYARYY